MRFVPDLSEMLLIALIARAGGETPTVPTPQLAHIAGTATDANGDLIPGATVAIEGGSAIPELAVANDNGAFEIDNLTPGTAYRVKVTADGFADWSSSTITLSPGQFEILKDITLTILGETTSVTVVADSREESSLLKRSRPRNTSVYWASFPIFTSAMTRILYRLQSSSSSNWHSRFRRSRYLRRNPFHRSYHRHISLPKLRGRVKGIRSTLWIYLFEWPDRHQGRRRYSALNLASRSAVLLSKHGIEEVAPDSRAVESSHLSGRKRKMAAELFKHRRLPCFRSDRKCLLPDANRGIGLLSRIFAIDFSANIANGVLQEFVLRRLTSSVRNRN